MVRRKRGHKEYAVPQPDLKVSGGNWHMLADQQVADIAQAAVEILTTIGLSEAPPVLRDTIIKSGGHEKDGRLLYPVDLVMAAINDGPKTVLLAGQSQAHDLNVGGTTGYVGTGGAAPNVVDLESDEYRPSNLKDLYDAARLADALPYVQFFARSLVARDIEDPRDLDVGTALASLAGTSKHVMVQAAEPEHVRDIAEICYRIAGSKAAFCARPSLSLNINHIVPPLRFHDTSVEVMAEAVAAGIPVHCNVFGQLGASSPVTMAGSVAQTTAETLAGLAFVHALDPKAPRIAGPRPMITDLRTGGMAGGAGEQAVATAMAAQVMRYWDIPCSVIAGATDSKLTDFQSGYEKALSVTSALQAGANLVTQAAGTQAGLMGLSYPAMVADNEMLGAILRANVAPEVTPETLALEAIGEVVKGEGHFLGRSETYARMRSDFLYPEVADRRSLEDWMDGDQTDMAAKAKDHAVSLLKARRPDHLDGHLFEELVATYPDVAGKLGMKR